MQVKKICFDIPREAILGSRLLRFLAETALPSADAVVILDKGTASYHQAPFGNLSFGDYLHKGFVPEEQDGGVSTSVEQEHKTQENRAQGKSLDQRASADLLRKTGDLGLYKFYLNSVGPLLFIIWLALAGGYIFSGKAPRTSQRSLCPVLILLIDCSQRSSCEFGLRTAPLIIPQHTSERT